MILEQPVLVLGREATSCNVNLLCPIRASNITWSMVERDRGEGKVLLYVGGEV